MPNDSNTNASKQQASLPPEKRPSGADPARGAQSGELQRDATDNPSSGERGQASDQQQQQQQGGGSSPGLKDRDNPTSDSYGNTRDSGDPASR